MRRQKRKIPSNGGYVMPSTLASSPESGKFTHFFVSSEQFIYLSLWRT